MSESWTCAVCGTTHEGIALDWGFSRPAYWDEERDSAEGFLNPDICVIRHSDGSHDYFVRGLIEIPILDGMSNDEDYFGIGAWVSLSATNFDWYVDNYEADSNEQGEPWFGWLSNSVPVYPETLNLKTNVYLRGSRWRPKIELQPADHPLAVDEQNGITLAQARELASRWHHL